MFVITVPHAACPQFTPFGHPCDWAAKPAADCIARHLKSSKVFANLHVRRSRSIDMNRIGSRDQPYRKSILEYVQNPKNKVKFVLDAHSFPADYGSYARWEVLVLDDDRRPTSYTLDFVETLVNQGINAGWLRGRTNDIHVQMRRVAKVPSFLVEFKEGIAQSRMDNLICPAIAKWLSRQK